MLRPMGSHPANLAVRFILELAALAGMALWGWRQGQGASRYVMAVGVPVVAAALWATFAVPHDPSRSGSAPVPIPGILRLCLEVAFFVFAAWALYETGKGMLSGILAVMVLAHYAVSYDRVAWLLRA
jgi:hypothetical protein